MSTQKELKEIRKELNTMPTTQMILERAQYVNFVIEELEYKYNDLYAVATAAHDMITQYSEDEWMIGLTSDEIDSILLVEKNEK